MQQKQTVVKLLRNATVLLQIDDMRFLIDPMLSDAGQLGPVPWSNEQRNPLVPLPVSTGELEKIIDTSDCILITHLHPDHWDEKAAQLIPLTKPFICQPQDQVRLMQQGFTQLNTDECSNVGKVRIIRVPAQHGRGELGEKMAPASGYMIQTGKINIYITGDTVWCDSLENILIKYRPDIIIANSGAARFNFGEPITLTAEEVIKIAENSKNNAIIIVVHMEAINHCSLTRADLKKKVENKKLQHKVLVPEDGEQINLII
jgi:L-ascorbate metabolism protein UlaG (beta-lactamase superfamily)